MFINYKKITKGTARKMFNAGKEIYLHTNKLSWNNMWQNPIPVTIDIEAEKSNAELRTKYIANGFDTKTIDIPQFDKLVNSYSYYNCDNERGNVVIYLISY